MTAISRPSRPGVAVPLKNALHLALTLLAAQPAQAWPGCCKCRRRAVPIAPAPAPPAAPDLYAFPPLPLAAAPAPAGSPAPTPPHSTHPSRGTSPAPGPYVVQVVTPSVPPPEGKAPSPFDVTIPLCFQNLGEHGATLTVRCHSEVRGGEVLIGVRSNRAGKEHVCTILVPDSTTTYRVEAGETLTVRSDVAGADCTFRFALENGKERTYRRVLESPACEDPPEREVIRVSGKSRRGR